MHCPVSETIDISGYYPGAIGHVTTCHAIYYHDVWGFDLSFEVQVSGEMAEFMSRFDPATDGLWTARIDNRFIGSVAIDGHPPGETGARLRWFIVEPAFQGTGIGNLLLEACLPFCRAAGHRRVFLWTFEGLHAARTLYERKGFRLAKEHRVDQWGRIINEQMFELDLT